MRLVALLARGSNISLGERCKEDCKCRLAKFEADIRRTDVLHAKPKLTFERGIDMKAGNVYQTLELESALQRDEGQQISRHGNNLMRRQDCELTGSQTCIR